MVLISQSFLNHSDPVATDRSLNSQPNAVHCRGVLSVFIIDAQSILAVGILDIDFSGG